MAQKAMYMIEPENEKLGYTVLENRDSEWVPLEFFRTIGAAREYVKTRTRPSRPEYYDGQGYQIVDL